MTVSAMGMPRFIIPGLVLVLAACTRVGPDYQAPGIDLGKAFAGGKPQVSAASLDTAWWQAFRDPQLTRLLERGAAQNLDLKAALARIGRAEGLLRTTGLNAQTSGDVSEALVRTRVEDLPISNNQSTTFDAAFVVDLFGGFARDRERAKATYDAAQFDVGVARLAVLAEITNAYIEARYHQAMVGIINSAITSDRRTLELVSERQRIGLSTQLERQQAIARLATTEAELPLHRAQFDIQVYRIATLLAEPAAPLLTEIRGHSGQPRPKAIPRVGVPADLLRNRPDIRVAERSLAAETAAVGVAEAQLYPSLTLTGSITNDHPRDTWSFRPALVIPVLNRGKLLGNRDAQVAAARAAELDWRGAVLNAVEEVQVALRETRAWSEQDAILSRATRATRRLEALTTEQYNLGQVALSEVLEAKRQLDLSRQNQANAIRQYALAWSRTQIAAGYGWATPVRPAAETAPPQAPPDPLGLGPVVARVQ